jgi:hypothetical protein
VIEDEGDQNSSLLSFDWSQVIEKRLS